MELKKWEIGKFKNQDLTPNFCLDWEKLVDNTYLLRAKVLIYTVSIQFGQKRNIKALV